MTANNKLQLYDFFAALFILSAPYLHFVNYQDFRFEYLNVLVLACFALIAGAGAALMRLVSLPAVRVLFFSLLLLYFIDVQFDWFQGWGGRKLKVTVSAVVIVGWSLRRHLSEILMVTFGVIIVGTLAASLIEQSFDGSLRTANAVTPNEDLPIYVHIILDEQIGIEAFDENIENQNAIKGELTAFFTEYGFRVFGRAFSHYYNSSESISSVLNLRTSDTPRQWYTGAKSKYELSQSSYFEGIRSAGYNINVYQSTYMDVCKAIGEATVTKCLTYKHHGISSAALSELVIAEKAKIVLSMYGGLSFFLEELRAHYMPSDRRVERSSLDWSDWFKWSKRVGPIPVLPVFDELIKDVASSARGTMYFAHLLIPHHPYSVDAECHIRRPVLRWLSRSTAQSSNNSNTLASRTQRYDEYILQIRCALSKLDELFQVMEMQGTLDDAIIIVHGDHGSRIVRVEPRTKNKSRLSVQDFHDAFSTLFAVKSPGLPSGYDSRMMGLPRLLRDTVVEAHGSISSAAEEAPFVYLHGGNGAPSFSKVPMPEMPSRHR